MINFLTQGKTGFEFADYVIEGNSIREWDMLASLGVEPIIEIARQSPAWQIIAPIEPRFRTFLEQFVQWTENWNDEPDTPEAIQ